MKLLLIILISISLSAEDKKPATAPDYQAEITSLKAQLASAQADLKVVSLRFQYQMQVCGQPDLAQAVAAADEARKQVEAAKPKDKPDVKPPVK